MKINRRQFTNDSLRLLAGTLLTGTAGRALGQAETGPFMLHIHVRGALDQGYLFDARDFAIRRAGLMSSYLPEAGARERWESGAGQSTLVGPAVQILKEHFQAGRFSIVNGVQMAFPNDNHEANSRFLFTGSAAGNLSYLNKVARSPRAPADRVFEIVQIGDPSFAASQADFENSVTLTPGVAAHLAATLTQAQNSLTKAGFNQAKARAAELSRAIDAAAKENGRTPGPYARSVRNLGLAFDQSGALLAKLGEADRGLGDIQNASWKNRIDPQMDPEVGPPAPEPPYAQAVAPENVLAAMRVVEAFFNAGLTQCAVIDINLDPEIDAHDPRIAQRQNQIAAQFAETVKKVLDYAAGSGVGARMLDRVCIVISTEFGRSLFQLQDGQKPQVDNSGTDHNKLCNTVLLAGAGIRGGLIVGGSDLTTLNAAGNGFADVLSAHRQIEIESVGARYKDLNCAMGRVLDFATLQVVSDLAAAPDPSQGRDYLSYQSINNALLSMFGYDWSDADNRQKVFLRANGTAQAPALRLQSLIGG